MVRMSLFYMAREMSFEPNKIDDNSTVKIDNNQEILEFNEKK